MSVINSQPLIGASGNQSTAYNLTRSLRFRSSASAYLNRTPASAGNRQTWTWSAWVKRGSLTTGLVQYLFDGRSSGNQTSVYFATSDALQFEYFDGTNNYYLTTSQVFRDPSAWYHIVAVWDTTQATSSNRMKLYVNGTQVTAFSTAIYPTQNLNGFVNNTNSHAIGGRGDNLRWFDGYIAETNLIDGQALTPSDFGETDTATGVWKPKKYTGTYGTNGFYLKFDNLTSTSTLGNDSSGNSNTWTVNNISLTSGSTYDSMKDVPTLTDADTANYCVVNPLTPSSSAISNGNLTMGYNSSSVSQIGTMAVSSGKWYFETTITSQNTSQLIAGIANSSFSTSTSGIGADANSWGLIVQNNANNGQAYHNGSVTSSYATFTAGDVLMVAYDVTNGYLWFGRNGTWFNSGVPASGTGYIYSNATGTISPAFSNNTSSGGVLDINFGQRPFAYTPPSGFKALNTFNLPTPTIGATASTQANDYFDVSLWTGNGSTQSITNSGSMQPDFVWIKGRSTAWGHRLADAVRGVGKELFSNDTSAELTNNSGGYLTSFNSNGFSINSGAGVNTNNDTYVAWQWKANGAGSSNTAGTITSTVSANTTAGFSIVTFTLPTTVNATIGHGLGVAPSLYFVKGRSVSSGWPGYHKSLGAGGYIQLQSTSAFSSSTTAWNNTAPTSTVFSMGPDFSGLAGTWVAYCFAEVAGYSKFGSYTGNGSSDGTFVYTGFRPKFVLIKPSSANGEWIIWDTTRSTYNYVGVYLFANSSDAEGASAEYLDLLSNGFKIRTTNTTLNASGQTNIYIALAENPFKYSLAR